MEEKQLEERIANKEKAIEKINKRIVKWNKRKDDDSYFWKDNEYLIGWNNGEYTREYIYERFHPGFVKNCESEIRCARRDLEEATATLNKYKDALASLIKYHSEEKIQVLWDFLLDWKKNSKQWYINNCNLYFELKDHEKEACKNRYNELMEEDLKRENVDPNNPNDIEKFKRLKDMNKDYVYGSWRRNEYYGRISGYTYRIAYYYNKFIDIEQLEKDLETEMRRKYEDLIARITDVVGEITNVSNLSIGAQNGEINGTIEGPKGTATITTISAGGYNIQCFHYRVLIHKIK